MSHQELQSLKTISSSLMSCCNKGIKAEDITELWEKRSLVNNDRAYWTRHFREKMREN